MCDYKVGGLSLDFFSTAELEQEQRENPTLVSGQADC